MGGYLELPPFFLFSLGDGMTIQFPFGKEVTMCFHQCNRKQLWGIGGVHVHIFAALIHILRWSSTSCTEVPAETSYPPQFAAPDIGLVIEFVVWWRRYFPQCLNESIFSGAIVNTENIPKHMGKKHPNSLWSFHLKTEGLERFSHQEITPIFGWSNPGKFTLRLISFVCHDLIHMRKNADMYWFPKLVPELGRHLVKENRFWLVVFLIFHYGTGS